MPGNLDLRSRVHMGRRPRQDSNLQPTDSKAGDVIFTTIQKFFPDEKGDTHPMLSDCWNIVVIADEAHRSQYDFVDGFARHMCDALPRLHLHLRHPAGRGGRHHGAHLLREPLGQTDAGASIFYKRGLSTALLTTSSPSPPPYFHLDANTAPLW